ncbi:MAG: hypothetical protein LBF81_05220 [Prevotellaceae bacterium]|jgi:hypothetical protein|nr:hypothetical protein [Prevotellaceae bacterium]
MNIYEKAGDLVIDLAKLVFGGVILASIISENINTTVLYLVGSIITGFFILSGFLFYKLQKRKK